MTRTHRNQYEPDRVSPPGETLLEVLEERGMSQSELAERTGRPAKTVNEIIRGKCIITPETALQLERVLGIPAHFWNQLEKNYREHLARRQEAEDLAESGDWYRRFPWRLLVKRGWVRDETTNVGRTRAMLDFFGIASPQQWQQVVAAPQASFRRSSSFVSQEEPLAVWLRRGEQLATAMHCRPYERARFKAALQEARALTREPVAKLRGLLARLCSSAGVAVVFVPELPGCRAHGVTRWLSKDKALIQLSLRYRTDDHLWFTFFHEAGHILLHPKRATFLETEKMEGEKEEEANRFAAEFLIPVAELAVLRPHAGRISQQMVTTLADRLGIAPGIVVGRLQHEEWLPYKNLNGLKEKLVWDESSD